MTLPARAASIRGDDYQHVIGLYNAGRILTDPELESVSIEDADGGAFDDAVVRATASSGRAHEYNQVKSGVYRETVIDNDWLVKTRTVRSKSPLQHFHRTWVDVTAKGEPFILRLVSNKNFDHNDPILGLIDNLTDRIPRWKLDGLGPNSAGGKHLAAWAEHLEVPIDDLKDFLTEVIFVHGESESSWADRAAALMRNAGFRGDDDAVVRGVEMVRGWVKNCAGPRTREDIQAEMATKGLLARAGELVLAIHAVDRAALPHHPNAEIDIVELYRGGDPFERRQLLDPAAWDEVVMPRLAAAKEGPPGLREQEPAHRRGDAAVDVLRGRPDVPDVGRWVLSSELRGVLWSTIAEREDAAVEVLCDEDLDLGGNLALAIGLTHDPTSQVRDYITGAGLPVAKLLTLSTPGGATPTSVPGPGWAADWVRHARERARGVAGKLRPPRVHLFLAAPAGVALFLGHDWNLMPDTTVYDHVGFDDYVPTMTFRG